MALLASDEMVLVQNALIDLGRAGPYWKLVYSADTQKVSLADDGGVPDSLPVPVAPASVLCNEVASSTGAARSRRPSRFQGKTHDKTSWEWELHLAFNDHVSLTPFERILRAGKVLIPADTALGQRQVTVRFTSASYTHAPTQSPRTGTRVTYLVTVEFSPQ